VVYTSVSSTVSSVRTEGTDVSDESERSHSDGTGDTVRIVVEHGSSRTHLDAVAGQSLRDVLLEHGLSPYARVTERANCGGNGLCATCGVRIIDGPSADHWHDRLAARFGYPRLSCQIDVEDGMVVSLVEDKRVWGRRE
jgi:ferredoxin